MKQIADLMVQQPLGAGSGAQTWLCTPSERLRLTAAEVAVKVLEQPAGEHELRRAAEALQRYVTASSPHLVPVYEVGLWNDRLYLVKEFCSFGSLADMSSPGEGKAARAVADAARGAHALHEIGVAHRNIKPSNILLGPDGGKLDDIGLLDVLSPGQTVTGVGGAGAVEFIEPGVLRGEEAARASDIWSLGASLHLALCGSSVYGDLPQQGGLSVLRHLLSTLPHLSAALPPAFADIVRLCIAPDREDRYRTAADVADAIDALQGAVGSR